MEIDTKYFLELAEKKWHSPQGMIALIIVLLFVELFLLRGCSASGLTVLIVYAITAITVISIWIITNLYPKTKKDKVGFVVSIKCSHDKEYEKIREDFIESLRLLIKSGSLGQTFQFIEIPRHIANEVNDLDDAQILRNKTRAHFVIYGRVRLRGFKNSECHIIDLNGLVTHKPIPKKVSKQISIEFKELLPSQFRVPTENDFLSLQITSDITEIVAKYIIGIASQCSYNLDYAESLFRDVQSKVEIINTDLPNIIKLKKRLPQRFREINEYRAKEQLFIWQKTKDSNAINKLSECLNKIPDDYVMQSYNLLLLKSVEIFLSDRNVEKSFEYVKKCKRFDDPVWHFNLAFLYTYKGNCKKAIQQYRQCENFEILPETLSQIEDFLVWILDQEPDKIQYYYCLGFFNWKIKGDYEQALVDFKDFINFAREKSMYEKEVELSVSWVRKIKQKIDDLALPEKV
ncbi:MAG: hypothetical protein PF482_17540 [Desulfobacteraceae bacterium]|jgi:hypothetical protein|nr:hypothetical protein [Desulfobacteraceae bacterium]